MTDKGRTAGSDSGLRGFFFLITSLAILAAGGWHYGVEENKIRRDKFQTLSAIADLKSGQIRQWRQERLGDIVLLTGNRFMAEAVDACVRGADPPGLRAALRESLQGWVTVHPYANALLLDPQGGVLIAAGDEHDPVDTATRRAVAEVLAGRGPVFSDFFRCPAGMVHIDVAAAVPGAAGTPLAVMVLRSNAETFLYPLIQSWPMPCRSAETLIVQREGNEIVFLNDLRHMTGAALTLRKPLTLATLPAVQAVSGRQGKFEGVDYRGMQVLADLRPIPESDWFLVAKVDADEILTEARYRAGATAVVLGALILLAAAASAYFHRQWQARHFRSLYESERRLREAQEAFRITLYSIGDAVITTDTAGRVREMNPASEALTGWMEAEARGLPLERVFRIVNEETREQAEDPVRRVLRDGEVVGLANHTLLIARDGSERPIADSAAPIRDDAGTVVGVVLVFQDQTEERLAQRALAESEERLRLALTAADQGLYDLNVQTGECVVTPEYARMLGYDPAEFQVTNAAWHERLHPEDREEATRVFEDYVAGRRADYRVEFRHQTRDGGWKWILSLGRIVSRGADGAPLRMLGTHTDITNRKQAEEERRRLEGQLVQAQKMEAVGRLAGGVAHDFNNMLGVILGFGDMAMNHLEPDSPARECMEEVKLAAERSAELTRQLLAFARKQTIAPRVLDLNETVAGILKMLRRLIGEDIDLLWKPGKDLWAVRMDPSQIDQVLANLTLNARDAIAGVGKITIETANAEIDANHCTSHEGFAPGRFVRLTVSDNGRGMDKEAQERLFEPFFTTKAMGRGTGLGLATVYGIVRQNHGFIDVTSVLGQGSTFKIYLPREEAAVESVSPTQNPEAAPTGTETVLLVEDEKPLLKFAQILLKDLGYRVLAASGPREALRLAEDCAEEIHLLLTDMVMPEMSGGELSELMSSLRPGIRSLFMSGYTTNVVAHRGVLDEGVHFIQKPFSREALAGKIRQAMA